MTADLLESYGTYECPYANPPSEYLWLWLPPLLLCFQCEQGARGDEHTRGNYLWNPIASVLLPMFKSVEYARKCNDAGNHEDRCSEKLRRASNEANFVDVMVS